MPTAAQLLIYGGDVSEVQIDAEAQVITAADVRELIKSDKT
jgi:hypothetical protein